jgi:hypothetical protein
LGFNSLRVKQKKKRGAEEEKVKSEIHLFICVNWQVKMKIKVEQTFLLINLILPLKRRYIKQRRANSSLLYFLNFSLFLKA